MSRPLLVGFPQTLRLSQALGNTPRRFCSLDANLKHRRELRLGRVRRHQVTEAETAQIACKKLLVPNSPQYYSPLRKGQIVQWLAFTTRGQTLLVQIPSKICFSFSSLYFPIFFLLSNFQGPWKSFYCPTGSIAQRVTFPRSLEFYSLQLFYKLLRPVFCLHFTRLRQAPREGRESLDTA